MVQDGVRWFKALNGNGKGLTDAKRTAHSMKFMKTSQQNRIRTVATACCSSHMGWRYSEFICSADHSKQRKASKLSPAIWQTIRFIWSVKESGQLCYY